MSNQLKLVILFAAMLINGCATPTEPAARNSFAELCLALGKTDGQISKEEFLAAAKDKEQAEKIFDSCEKNN